MTCSTCYWSIGDWDAKAKQAMLICLLGRPTSKPCEAWEYEPGTDGDEIRQHLQRQQAQEGGKFNAG